METVEKCCLIRGWLTSSSSDQEIRQYILCLTKAVYHVVNIEFSNLLALLSYYSDCNACRTAMPRS